MSGVSGGLSQITSPNPPPFSGAVTNKWGAARDYNNDGVYNERHTGTDLGWRAAKEWGGAPGRSPSPATPATDTGRGGVDHGNGWATSYSHLRSIEGYRRGSRRTRQTIGTVGNSGGKYRDHLHYEVAR
jgi:murein DD-endopeptidase MepM/ murein hydrolase activator NlpD